MTIDVYCSVKNNTKYLSVPAGTDVAVLSFPIEFDRDLCELRPFKKRLEIIPGKPYIALDSDDIAKQIAAKGYATHASEITSEVRVGKSVV